MLVVYNNCGVCGWRSSIAGQEDLEEVGRIASKPIRVATVEILSVDSAGAITEDDPISCCCQTNPGMIACTLQLPQIQYTRSAETRLIQV